MKTGLAALVRHDMRLKWRYGIHIAYAFVIGFYGFGLAQIGGFLPGWLVAVVIYTDPAVVGFFFLGALMMLEKGETVRMALAVTPLRAGTYLAAKVLTLTFLALIAVSALIPVVPGPVDPLLLWGATGLTSLAFLGLGVPAALYFRTVTSYLIGAAGFMLPLVGPAFFALLDPMPAWAVLFPTASQLKLILVALHAGTASPLEMAAMLVVSALTALGALYWAWRRLQSELGVK